MEEASLINMEKPNEKTMNSRCYPLVSTFHPNLPNVSKIINKHKYILNIDKKVADVIKPDNVFASFRRNKSLGDSLVHSRFPTWDIQSEPGSRKCDSGCAVCTYYLVETTEFTSYHTDKIFRCTYGLTCEDPYIIYLINDLVCKRSSVGRSENPIRPRWANHKSHIKRNVATCKVATHFNEKGTNHK